MNLFLLTIYKMEPLELFSNERCLPKISKMPGLVKALGLGFGSGLIKLRPKTDEILFLDLK
jgi:hypothetical protein